MGALERLKRCGFDPIAVIDIGAQLGTPSLFSTFPNSKHLWIEPVEECLPQLNSLAGNLKDAHVIHAAAANKDGITELSIADNLSYSSIEEKRGSISRQIKTYKVDTLAKQFSISGQVLIKIDVDGAELNVLTGSVELLGLPDILIIIEASIGDRNPRIAPIVQFLGRLGYDVFDIIEPLYSLSERLWQVDLVFVQRRSVYWGSREFLALD
jgi:FkbM family methyltransferase